jgi:thioredoxin reductase
MNSYDALIVGGGPAGLSAALILGRCRRKVLVCDAAHYRNEASFMMNGFLSRDGISPKDFLKICREQLKDYPDVKLIMQEVVGIERHAAGFKGELSDGNNVMAEKVILATGIDDEIPDIPGILDFFGTSVFLCPYCDGWEFCDQPIAVYGQKDRGPCFALLMKKWSSDIVLCTDGEIGGTAEEQARLGELHIPVVKERIIRLEGTGGQLKRIIFENGKTIERTGLFFNTEIRPKTKLAESLGCRINARGEVEVDSGGLTNIPGVYVAGDASPDLKLVITAAAEGAKAAYALNKELLKEEKLILK